MRLTNDLFTVPGRAYRGDLILFFGGLFLLFEHPGNLAQRRRRGGRTDRRGAAKAGFVASSCRSQ